MGGKGSSTPDPAIEQGQLANSTALVDIAKGQSENASKLFATSFPGFKKAEEYYGALSSGDPYAIFRAISPVAQQADVAAGAAKTNILNNGPAGGEKTLALEQVDVNRGAQVGDAATKGYTGSFNALAQLGGQGVGESQNAAGLGISGLNSSSSTLGSVFGEQFQQQQLQAEQKGNSLGALTSLGGDIAGAAGEAGGFATLFAGL